MADWHTLFNALDYVYGQCTQFVAGTFSWVHGNWGNGCQWADNAKRDGLTISSKPAAGSVAVYDCSLAGSGGNGHVAAVSAVNPDGSFVLHEANWDAFNMEDTRIEHLGSGSGAHIIGFILPPGMTASSDSGVQTTSLNPTDSIASTITAIGKQIEQDLFKIALIILGVFVVFVGIGLLLSSELRSNLESSVAKTPGGVHGDAANKGLEVAESAS